MNYIDPTGYFAETGQFPTESWFDNKQKEWNNTANATNLQKMLIGKGFWGLNGKLTADGKYGSNTRFAHESYFLMRYTAGIFKWKNEPGVKAFQEGLNKRLDKSQHLSPLRAMLL